MLKKSVLFLAVLLIASFASAATVSVTDVTSTLKTVDISSASDLYAYEVNFSIDSGSIGSVTHANFLGSGSSATYGSNEKNSYLYVYGSKLDSTQTGVSGDGQLFNVSFTGGITLKGHVLVDKDGTATYTTYNADGTTTVTTTTTSGSSGGGGGGGATTSLELKKLPNLIVVPSNLNINAILGKEEEREIVVSNNGDKALSLSVILEGFGGNVIVTPSFLSLAPGEEKTVILKISAEERGLMTGKVRFRSGNEIVAESSVVVNVMSENFLFDSSISLSRSYRTISLGENLIAQIDLKQVGPKEKVDVVANYIIKDFAGNSYLEDSETFYVLGEKSFTKEFHTANLPPGKYVLGLEIVYPGAFATSSVQFEVLEKEPLTSKLLEGDLIIVLGLSIAIIVIAVVIVWALRRGHKRRKRH